MKTLLLLRHAKSSWKNPELADHDRPLNKRGKRDAPRMGEQLAALDLCPELILSSTAKRARSTALLAAQPCQPANALQIQWLESLYLATPADIVAAVHTIPDELGRAMIVGHNPGLEETLTLWARVATDMPTATLAQLAFDVKSWNDISPQTEGNLIGIWRPRQLD